MTGEMNKPPTELEPRDIRWLWRDRLAIGKLTSMVGLEDRKKSFLCSTIAATTNRGGEWPDDGRADQGHVVYLQGEDGFFDTTLPRLLAAGAQVTNEPIHIEGPPFFTIVPPKPKAPSLVAALNALEKQHYLAKRKNMRLLIVDPFNAFSEGRNSHHMAGALHHLQHVAEKYDIAVLLVHHFNKQLRRTVREMIYGSSMVRSISRVTLAVQADPDDSSRSILTGSKCNIAPGLGEGLIYGMSEREVKFEGGKVKPFPTVAWLGPDDRTADELAAELFDNVKVAGKQSKERRVNGWIDFLAEHMNPGVKMRVTDIETKARATNLLRPNSLLKDCRPADHAVKELGIQKIPGSPDGGGHAVSWWLRPRDDDERDGDERERDDGGNGQDHAHPALNDEVTK
jgi:AAA domain